ncbi:MAG: hypothetical protein ACOYI9_11040 [Candidatus Hydrogenedentales bacterium]
MTATCSPCLKQIRKNSKVLCLKVTIAGDEQQPEMHKRPRVCNLFLLLPVAIALLSFLALPTVAEDTETHPPSISSEFTRNLYHYGCGPISVYISAKRLGCEITLQELLDRGWGDEPRRLSLKEICALVHTIPSLRAEGVRLTPENLPEVVACEDIAAILVIRQDASLEMPNHTVVLETRPCPGQYSYAKPLQC